MTRPFSFALLSVLAALPIRPAGALETVRFDELKPAPLKLDVKDARRRGENRTHNSGISGSMVQRHFGDSQFSVAPIKVFENRLAALLGERLQGVPITITELRITAEANAPSTDVSWVPLPGGATPIQAGIGTAIAQGIIDELVLTRLAEEQPYRVYCVIYGNVGRWPFSGSFSKSDPDPKQLHLEMKAVVERAIANAMGDLEKRLVLLQQQAPRTASTPAETPAASPAASPSAAPAAAQNARQEQDASRERGRGRGRYRTSGDVPLENRSGN